MWTKHAAIIQKAMHDIVTYSVHKQGLINNVDVCYDKKDVINEERRRHKTQDEDWITLRKPFHFLVGLK